MLQNLQTLSQEITHSEEMFETPSPSRTAQSMTSGDLGDISSISTTPSIPDRRSYMSSRLSKGSSKSSSSSSLSRISSVETVLPPDGGKRSDVLQRSSTSSLASVAFSDLMSSATTLGRRSSVLGSAATNQASSKKSIDVPLQRAGRPVALETTHVRPNVALHPADMDTMIFPNQWDMIGRGTTAAIGQNVVNPRRSSSSIAPSDLLFPDDDEKRLSKDSCHSRSTSGNGTDTDHALAGDLRHRSSGSDDHLFSRPAQPLARRSSSHVTSGGQPDREKVTETVALGEVGIVDGEKEADKSERLDILISTDRW